MPADTRQAPHTDPATDAVRAFAHYDSLDVVDCDFMIGRWRGEGYFTGHALDGVLERFGWYGKEFVDSERVHPLLFHTATGSVRQLNPALMPLQLALRFPQLNNPLNASVFRLIQPLMATGTSKARLRMLEYRGKLSAAMCYDQRPILDVFRRVDDDTALGIMDMKGMHDALFFLLRRDHTPSAPRRESE